MQNTRLNIYNSSSQKITKDEFEVYMSTECLVIIVTHNSQKHIQWCLDGLATSESDLSIKIVDSGSNDTSYLDNLSCKHKLEVIKKDNIGFVKGNNLVLQMGVQCKWTLLLNPDAAIDGSKLDKLLTLANETDNDDIGIFSVPLIRYSIDQMKEMDVYDSLGIAATSYGRWYDIGSSEPLKKLDSNPSEVLAVCGAFMLIRNDALKVCLDKSNSIGFESSYHMYKEDIELCLRFRKYNWKVMTINHLNAYHCRGWNKPRGKIPFWAKYHSAINDLDLAFRYKKMHMPYAISKYLWVNFVERFKLI